jgi:hypothetical protein
MRLHVFCIKHQNSYFFIAIKKNNPVAKQVLKTTDLIGAVDSARIPGLRRLGDFYFKISKGIDEKRFHHFT